MKKARKSISILLTVVTLLSVISAATPVFAAEVTEVTETIEAASENAETAESEETENTEPATEEMKTEDAEILYEDTSRRDKYTKHFVMDNGLRKAVKFAQPIHYEENGEWVDIDNTLEFNQETEKYENKRNSFKVEFDKSFNSNEFFTVENKGYAMSWRYDGSAVRSAFVNGKTENILNHNNIYQQYAQRTNSKIKYNKFESDCDLEYIVTGTGVKENIILEKYSGKNEFSFEITANGLSFIKNDDGSVSVVNQNSVEIFFIPAPFMYDSNNEYSYYVEYLIEEKKDKITITIVADEEWLKDSNRKYPEQLIL